jgi:pilus assembly protein CpaC
MNAGKSTLIDLPEPVVRRTVGDPGVVDSRMVSAQVLYMASARIGSTNVILQGRSGRCVLLDVVVGIDTDAVQAKITELMPDEPNVRVTAAGDSLVLTGVVRDAAAVERAVVIANAYVRTGNRGGVSRVGGVSGASGSGGGASAGGSERADAGAAPLSARVVNLLSVSSAQQVMLEVKVAEVSKNLLDKLGASVGGIRTSGAWTYTFLTNFLSGALGATLGGINARGDQFSIEAEKRDGLVRILAEPNVMAISGQEGSFLAGGKILIPVAQASGTGAVAVTLEEKEFGVGLRFTPTVLADGRINLRVAPEVSELSRQGVGVSTGTFSSTVLPLISTRRASTTVQLFDGQSFAIGGLIKSSGASTVRALPILGELPIIGALFRSTEFQNENTELVFIVTPRLVKPLGPNYVLPTDRIGTPGRAALMLDGRLDSDGIPPVPASVSPRPAAPVFEIK